MADKVKVQVEGKEVEVELPAGYIAESQVKERFMPKDVFASELERRVSSITAGMKKPEELLEDEGFRTQAVAKWGIKTANAEDIAKQRQAWEESALKPVQEKLTATEGKAQKLLNRQRNADIVQAAAAIGVKPVFLKPPADGVEPPIVNMLAGVFAYDEQTDGWYVRDGEGFAYSNNPTKTRPYKTPEEFVAEWAKTETAKELLEPRARDGIGYRGADGKVGVVGLEQFEKMTQAEQDRLYAENTPLWRELMAKKREKNEAGLNTGWR